MRILLLGWKDITHPNKGGAEVIIYEYAKGLVSKGHEVFWVGSKYPKCSETETIDGIQIHRTGSITSIYFTFSKYYKKHFKGNVDVILDQAGGLPFLTPMYEKKIPIIFMIHHIGHREWDDKYSFPFNIIGKKLYNAMIGLYKNHTTITVSNSTRQELVNYFKFDEEKIEVFENALDIDLKHEHELVASKKSKSILYFGRVLRMKRVDDAIKAFGKFSKVFPDYHLNIIGPCPDKEYEDELLALTQILDIQDKVSFHGKIGLDERHKIADNRIMLVPSELEGYGLIVLEGNVYGIPSLGYNVRGIRDSICSGKNGFTFPFPKWSAMTDTLIELCSDETKLDMLSQSAYNHVCQHVTWQENIDRLEALMSDAIKKK